jgi:hypothetical protein
MVWHDVAELASFRGYLVCILTCEHKTNGFGLQDIEVILKRILAKGIDLIQTTGLDKYCVNAVAFVLQDVKELASRSAVKIALHDQIQPVAVLANRDFEIRRHDTSFSRAIWY